MNILSAEEFRKKLAGLTDPNQIVSEEQNEEIKQKAVLFCSILPELFGDDLKRITLWERIAHGLVVSSAKCNGDIELFINQMLIYIKADPGNVAANKNMSDFIDFILSKEKMWWKQFIRICESKYMFICVKARMIWNVKKEENKKKEKFYYEYDKKL